MMAIAVARGMLRDASFTSPDGISAVSMPEYAKITRIIAGPIAAQDGTSVNDTNDQSTKNIPTIVKMNSGVSFNAANVLIARVPSLTPNAFNASSKIYTDASTSTRVEPEPTDGKNFAS